MGLPYQRTGAGFGVHHQGGPDFGGGVLLSGRPRRESGSEATCCLGVVSTRTHVWTVMLGDMNTITRWLARFLQGDPAVVSLWEDFQRDSGLTWRAPAVEAPTWMYRRGCQRVIDHILTSLAMGPCHVWVDTASPFPMDHRPVVLEVVGVSEEAVKGPVALRIRHPPSKDSQTTRPCFGCVARLRQGRMLRMGTSDLWPILWMPWRRALPRLGVLGTCRGRWIRHCRGSGHFWRKTRSGENIPTP